LMFVEGTSITPTTNSRIVMMLVYVLPQIGIWGLWLSLLASLWSAAQYTVTFSEKLKKIK